MSRLRSIPVWGWIIFSLLVIGILLLFPHSFDEKTSSEYAFTAQSFESQGELELAADTWHKVLENEPKNPEAAYRLGLLLTLLNMEKSEPYLRQAANLDPGYQAATARILNTIRLASFAEDPAYQVIQIGQSLAAEDEWQLAFFAFQRATQLNPEYTEAWAYLGLAQQELGQDGYQALSRAIELNPESLAANALMGAYWRSQGEPEKALPFFQTASDLDPENLNLLADLGLALADVGDMTGALDQFDKLVNLAPEDVQSWMVVAQFSLDYNVQLEEIGLPAARQAVLLDGQNPQALVLLARVYSQQGDTVLAPRFFERALQADPEYPPAHFYFGVYYLAHEDLSLAQEHLEIAVELSPDTTIGKQAQQVLDEYFN